MRFISGSTGAMLSLCVMIDDLSQKCDNATVDTENVILGDLYATRGELICDGLRLMSDEERRSRLV